MSKPLRIAMDIGGIAAWHQSSLGKVGISRAIESLAQALSGRPDVLLTLVGLCGGEPLYFSYLTTLFPYATWGATVQAAATVRSCFGLTPLYDWLMPAYIADLAAAPPRRARSSFRAALLRAAVKALKIADARPSFDAARYDVFLSTTMPLPSRSETGSLPRILMVFDLICIRQPESVTRAQTEAQERLMASVDVNHDWIICNSEFVKRDVCEYLNIDPARVLVVPLGASSEFRPISDAVTLAAVRARYAIPEEGDYLLTLAAFQPRKNVPGTLRAFARLATEHPELPIRLVLAGKKGQSTEEIDEALSRLGPKMDRIVFTGYVADEDLSALYSGARAFVFPSFTEGFGLPPLEAMRCRVPVISANTTSLPEVVGDTAILVDPADDEAICHAMRDMLIDRNLRERLAQAGWERAQSYTWESSAGVLTEALRLVAESAAFSPL